MLNAYMCIYLSVFEVKGMLDFIFAIIDIHSHFDYLLSGILLNLIWYTFKRFSLNLLVYFAYVSVWVSLCHSMGVRVRGQLQESVSFCLVGPGDQTQALFTELWHQPWFFLVFNDGHYRDDKLFCLKKNRNIEKYRNLS